VIGSILAVMIAQSYGFSLVIGLAVVIYLGGLAAVLSVGPTVPASAALRLSEGCESS
jgi:hypothetical protein